MGVTILGTSPEAIDRAEDRGKFQLIVRELGLHQPDNAMVQTEVEAVREAARIGYPIMVRPSYVLGGRAMEVVQDEDELRVYLKQEAELIADAPVLLDRF